MNMNLSAPLPSAQSQVLAPKTAADYPTRLVDITPGSTIVISGEKVGGPPITALVLGVYPEWGATGEPALHVVPDDTRIGEFVVSQAAGYTVTVTADSSQFITDQLPEGAVKLQVKPVHGAALQFVGGIQSAQAIVRWSLGRAAAQYSKGTDTEDETITFSGIGSAGGVARVGDWVVLHEDETFHIVSNLDDYEEVL
jgi:hypothetical protein